MSNDRKYRNIYVIGDIHGDYDGAWSVISQMFDDGYSMELDLLVQLGDLVDGFDRTRDVVGLFKNMQAAEPENIVVLKGNHEQLMIHGVEAEYNSDQFQVWWQQGGRETWESYWKQFGDPPLISTPYVPLTYEADDHIRWFKTLPTLFETEDYYFVHAGLEPEQPEARGTSIFARMWIRGPFLRSNRVWDKLVVHGHSPVKEPELLHNRVNVNTRPRGKGRVTGAKLSNDGTKQVVRLFQSEESIP